MTTPVDPEERARELERMNEAAGGGGGPDRIARQHEAGKLTARERIALLVDPGTFVELDRLKAHRCADFGMERQRVPGDGVVVGHGRVEGRPLGLFAQDFTVFGGSLSAAHAEKICKVMDLALEVGCPIVGLYDSGGARIQEGVAALAGYADIFVRHTRASGVVPQISVIVGPCAGSAVYGPAIGDFVFMARGISSLFVSGPDVIREATHEEVTREELAGAQVHAARSGMAHFAVDGEEATFRLVRELLGYLPQRAGEPLTEVATGDPAERRDERLRALVPADHARGYDVRDVIRAVVDGGRLLEVSAEHAPNLVTAFVRMAGRPVGVVANQPLALGGAIDIGAAVKGARFVRCCDAFGIPLLTLVDVPGFLPGAAQEWGGLARHGAKLLYAYAEASVPKVTVVTRRAHGGAYAMMGSKHLGADVSYAWPGAEIAVMRPEGAVSIIHRREILAAGPDVASQHAARQRFADEYRERWANPYRAAELGHLDEVIPPEETRPRVIGALELLRGKRAGPPRRKHGNLPL